MHPWFCFRLTTRLWIWLRSKPCCAIPALSSMPPADRKGKVTALPPLTTDSGPLALYKETFISQEFYWQWQYIQVSISPGQFINCLFWPWLYCCIQRPPKCWRSPCLNTVQVSGHKTIHGILGHTVLSPACPWIVWNPHLAFQLIQPKSKNAWFSTIRWLLSVDEHRIKLLAPMLALCQI